MSLFNIIMPAWSRWLVFALAGACIYLLGSMHGERVAGQRHIDYVNAQAAQTVKIARAQTQVVIETEVKYRDRIQKIYIKGDEIEKQIPVYVTPGDDLRFGVNAGFVRVYDAAWSGDDPGPGADTDRGPAAVSLTEISAVDAHNATSCRAWREQALGWREYYQKLKGVTNSSSAQQ